MLTDTLKAAYWHLTLSSVARQVRRDNLTYLSNRKIRAIERELARIETQRIPGDAIECGVAMGGSAILIASRLSGRRRFTGYDVFGMIPPPSERDDERSHKRYAEIAAGLSEGIGGKTYYGYENDLLAQVKQRFREFGLEPEGSSIRLVPGLFEETLTFTPGEALAFVHIDCDWHDPVAYCLETCYGPLQPGGVIVLDDYNDYGGCRVATDRFLAQHPDMRMVDSSSNAVLRKG